MAKNENKPYSISADQLFDQAKNREIVTTTLGVDLGISGGFCRGAVIGISGLPKSGKSSLALFTAAKAQHKYGAKVFYYALEGRVLSLVLSQVPSLKTDKDSFEIFMPPAIYDKDGKTVIGHKKWMMEDCLEHIGKTIEQNPGSVIIVDSISNLTSEKENSEDLSYADMGQKNKIEAAFARRYLEMVVPQKIILFLICQVIANPAYGFPFKMKISTPIKHACDYLLMGRNAKKWDEENGRIKGHTTTFLCEASALGQPYLTCELSLTYGLGPDEYKDIVDNCINFSIIKKSGSWLELPFISIEDKFIFTEIVDADTKERPKYIKVQGESQLNQWLRINKPQFEILDIIIRKKVFG